MLIETKAPWSGLPEGEIRVEVAVGDRKPSQFMLDTMSRFLIKRYREETEAKRKEETNE